MRNIDNEQKTVNGEIGWAEVLGIHEKCRVLAKAMLCAEFDKDDRDALAWMLQDGLTNLGNAIERVQKK